jgi:ribosomal protein S18 acetylase RimI-like enzyme
MPHGSGGNHSPVFAGRVPGGRIMSESFLDNPAWHALTGPHAHLALGQGAARHYPRDIAPYSAIAAPTAAAYSDLAADIPPGLEARLFRSEDECAPPGWKTLSARPITQMVADRSRLPAALPGEADILPLRRDNAAEMLELVRLARPGPFAPRTPLLGQYIGIRDSRTGQLTAMAGERFCLHGYVELSAIAVHPDARGRGYGAGLTAALARAAFARGDVPFLHVYADNPAASLYIRLGFGKRRNLWVLLWRRLTPAETE